MTCFENSNYFNKRQCLEFLGNSTAAYQQMDVLSSICRASFRKSSAGGKFEDCECVCAHIAFIACTMNSTLMVLCEVWKLS